MNKLKKSIIYGALAVVGLAATAGIPAKETIYWDGSESAPGVYFYRYDLSFYTGTAPSQPGSRTESAPAGPWLSLFSGGSGHAWPRVDRALSNG